MCVCVCVYVCVHAVALNEQAPLIGPQNSCMKKSWHENFMHGNFILMHESMTLPCMKNTFSYMKDIFPCMKMNISALT